MKKVKLINSVSKKKYDFYGSEKDKSIIGTIEYNNGFYEPHIVNLIADKVKKDFICIDIGANIGAISLILSEYCYKGQVYSFEPSKNNFKFLKKNINDNKINNVIIENYGLYSEDKDFDFSYVEEVAGCSFISKGDIKEGVNEKIQCIKLDNWIDKNKIKKIDFIKLDVEGAEIDAINGGIETFIKYKPKMIIEFNPNPMERFFNANPEDLYVLLKKIYRKIYLINDRDFDLLEINSYKDLLNYIKKGKGWEDLYCC